MVIVSTPHCDPNNIQLTATQGADKISIEAVGVTSETSATFKVTGIAASDDEDDVKLKATCRGSEATKTFTVVEPVSVGSPRPLTGEFDVQVLNLAINNSTSPYSTAVPPFHHLIVMALKVLAVQINDKFGNPLMGYEGSEVFESVDHSAFVSMNQLLNTNGQYADTVGIAVKAPNPPYSTNPTDDATIISQWISEEPVFSRGTGTEPEASIRIKIDDRWDLDAGKRAMVLTLDNKLLIDWN